MSKNSKDGLTKLENSDKVTLTKNIKDNIEVMKSIFAHDDSLIIREFENISTNIQFSIVYINEMINKDMVNEHIIRPLMSFNLTSLTTDSNITEGVFLDILCKKVIFLSELKISADINEFILKMMYGDTIILVNGIDKVLIADTKGFAVRPIEEPGSESVIKGSREAFTESIATNVSLIRKRIRTTKLKFIERELGEQTKTKICITYIEGIVSDKILLEFYHRLEKARNDSFLFSNSFYLRGIFSIC